LLAIPTIILAGTVESLSLMSQEMPVDWYALPIGLAGVALVGLGLENHLRLPVIIAISTIVFGLLLWWADVSGKRERDEYSLTWQDILLIGAAQVLALIPGTSRSGITITAALFLGLNRKAAARFSFLLAIPTIILAGTVESLSLMSQEMPVDWYALGLAVAFSGLSAYLCIHAFISLLNRIGMLPFVAYRVALGIFLLIWLVF
jgi:undecaprenyl-diphosphatase